MNNTIPPEIKSAFVKFFQWWWNQKGSNTEQGFDSWAETEDGKNTIASLYQHLQENGRVAIDEQPIPVNQDEGFDKFLSIVEEKIVEDKYWPAVHDVYKEVLRAKTMFKEDFVNQHEGYAVILEELDELWEEVKKNQNVYDLPAQRKEAIQCAAMCVRFAAELIDKNEQLKSSPSPTPVNEGEDYWKKLYTECEEILMSLCQLKHYKDNVGKDSLYEKLQPETWKRANDFLNTNPQTGKKYFENLSPEKFNKHFSQEGLREDEKENQGIKNLKL